MNYVDQEFTSGKHGDCLRACVATFLQLPRSKVPHFAHDLEDGQEEILWGRVNAFLRPRGLMLLETRYFNDWEKYGECYHLIFGPNCIDGMQHAVVGCSGVIVHDPHPARPGLDALRQDEWTFGFFGLVGSKLQ